MADWMQQRYSLLSSSFTHSLSACNIGVPQFVMAFSEVSSVNYCSRRHQRPQFLPFSSSFHRMLLMSPQFGGWMDGWLVGWRVQCAQANSTDSFIIIWMRFLLQKFIYLFIFSATERWTNWNSLSQSSKPTITRQKLLENYTRQSTPLLDSRYNLMLLTSHPSTHSAVEFKFQVSSSKDS